LFSRFRDPEGRPDQSDAIARAPAQISSGVFLKELDRRVGFKTESLNAERAGVLRAYLEEELTPAFTELDFTSRLIESPVGRRRFSWPSIMKPPRCRPC